MQVNSDISQDIILSKAKASFNDFVTSNSAFSSLISSDISVFPGFCDVHVHFREPGYFYKETVKTGSMAAARGGYTDCCTMPNLNPVPDCKKNLSLQKSIIDIDSLINIHPYGAITKGLKGEELSDMNALSNSVIAFTDDGKGVQSSDLMLAAMREAKSLNKIIAAHCEDNSLLDGGYIHKGKYAAEHGHRGISSESEWKQIERDLNLAAKTGCKYHVCHISCKESVDLIAQAKKSGVDVTCETAPHYLTLTEDDLQEDGRFKMNPPLRSFQDREALILGVRNGTIDILATDHAPHSLAEKSKGLKGSAFGIVGLETAFPIMYTKLVQKGLISLEKLIDIIAINPRLRFNIPFDKSFTVWDLNKVSTVKSDEFLSKGKATPFENMGINGECLLTVCKSRIVYRK